LLEYEGETYWFDLLNGEHEEHRIFLIHSLTPEQLEAVESSWGQPDYSGPEEVLVPVGWFTDGCNQKFYAFVVHDPGCDFRENCDCLII
jgi:hypothetical protein